MRLSYGDRRADLVRSQTDLYLLAPASCTSFVAPSESARLTGLAIFFFGTFAFFANLLGC